MPPHFFHALSDDPSRQFGCMAALFHQLFHHHARFSSASSRSRSRSRSRKRTMSPADPFPPSAAAARLSKPSIAGPANSSVNARCRDLSSREYAKSGSKEHCKKKNKDLTTNFKHNYSAPKVRRSPEKVSNRYKRSVSFPVDSPSAEAPSPSSHEKTLTSSSFDKCNESPSILNSTNYTIRESPQKCPAYESVIISPVTSNQECSISFNSCNSATSSYNLENRSSPSSPHMPLSQALKEARRSPARSEVCKSLFADKPRAPMVDVDTDLAPTAARPRSRMNLNRKVSDEQPRRSGMNFNHKFSDGLTDQTRDAAAPNLLGLQQSVKALKQFVEGFDAQWAHQNVKPAKRTSYIGSSSWWSNAKSKARLFKSFDQKCASIHTSNQDMEAPTAARTSSFDYNEAVRISQKIEETSARLSLDGRELVPKAVMKLREAMRLGHFHVNEGITEPLMQFPSNEASDGTRASGRSISRSIASQSGEDNSAFLIKHNGNLPSPDTSNGVEVKGGQRSNVIARLMGLDSLSSGSSSDGGSAFHSSKYMRPCEGPPFLFEDLQTRCPQRLKLDQPGHISSSSCIYSAGESQMREHDLAVASSTSVSKNETSYTHLAKAANVLIDKDEACCKGIGEVQFNDKGWCSIDKHSTKSAFKMLQARHVKQDVEAMSSSAHVTMFNNKQSYGSNRRARATAGSGHEWEDKVHSWQEENDVQNFAAHSKNHVHPCRIVVMEPRRSTRMVFPVNEVAGEAFIECDAEKEIPTKLSSNGTLASVGPRSADSGQKYIKPESDNTLIRSSESAISNLCTRSKKREIYPAKQNAGQRKGGQKHQEALLAKSNVCPSPRTARPVSNSRSGNDIAKEKSVCAPARASERLVNTTNRPGIRASDESMKRLAARLISSKEADSQYLKMGESLSSTAQCPINVAPGSKHVEMANLATKDNNKHKSIRKKSQNLAGDEQGSIKEMSRSRCAGEKSAGKAANLRADDEPNMALQKRCSGRTHVGVGGVEEATSVGERNSRYYNREPQLTCSALKEYGKLQAKSAMAMAMGREGPLHEELQCLSHELPTTTLSSCKKNSTTMMMMMMVKSTTDDNRRDLEAHSACNAPHFLPSPPPPPPPPLMINKAKENFLKTRLDHDERISKCLQALKLPPINIFAFPIIYSNNKHFACCNPLAQVSLAENVQNEEGDNCWTCHNLTSLSPIFNSICFSLEDAIFKDLILEIVSS